MGEEQAALGQRERPGQSSTALRWQVKGVELRYRLSGKLEMAALLHSREVIFPLQTCRQKQPNTQLVMACQ